MLIKLMFQRRVVPPNFSVLTEHVSHGPLPADHMKSRAQTILTFQRFVVGYFQVTPSLISFSEV